MTVYFVQRVSGGPIKIGYSSNLQARMASISTATPEKLLLLASARGCVDDEKRMHSLLSSHHVHKEWFEDCAAVRECIEHVLATGELPGTPSIMADKHPHALALDAIGKRTVCDHYNLSDRGWQNWKKAGVPKIYWNSLDLLARVKGKPQPKFHNVDKERTPCTSPSHSSDTGA